MPGIYGSKQTESEGVARGQGLFTTAINPWPPVLAITIIFIPPSIVLPIYNRWGVTVIIFLHEGYKGNNSLSMYF